MQKQTKVQKLKDTRDYSFLFSEDANVPAPTKESSRSVYAPSTGMLLLDHVNYSCVGVYLETSFPKKIRTYIE